MQRPEVRTGEIGLLIARVIRGRGRETSARVVGGAWPGLQHQAEELGVIWRR